VDTHVFSKSHSFERRSHSPSTFENLIFQSSNQKHTAIVKQIIELSEGFFSQAFPRADLPDSCESRFLTGRTDEAFFRSKVD
jgi:hypothetical protein